MIFGLEWYMWEFLYVITGGLKHCSSDPWLKPIWPWYMMCYVILNSDCVYFIENFMSMISNIVQNSLLWQVIFAWFWSQGNTYAIKGTWKRSFLFYFIEYRKFLCSSVLIDWYNVALNRFDPGYFLLLVKHLLLLILSIALWLF